MSIDILQQQVGALAEAFAEFKSTNDIPNKDVLTMEKLARINDSMDTIEKKLYDYDANQQRNQQRNQERNQEHNQQQGPQRLQITECDTKSFASSAENDAFFKYLLTGDDSGLRLQTKAQDEFSTDGNAGGYLLPQPLQEYIYSIGEQVSPMLQLARVRTISTKDMKVVTNSDAMEIKWYGEKEPRGKTKTPELKEKIIPLHTIAAAPAITQSLLDYGPEGFERTIIQQFAEITAMEQNEKYIKGSGAGEPRGVLRDIADTVTQDKIHSMGKKVRTAENLYQLYSALDSIYLSGNDSEPGAVWMMSRQQSSKLRGLKFGDYYIWQPPMKSADKATIFGHQVYVNDAMEKANADVIFGNFKHLYMIVQRAGGVRILRDPYTAVPRVILHLSQQIGGDIIDSKAAKCMLLKDEEPAVA